MYHRVFARSFIALLLVAVLAMTGCGSITPVTALNLIIAAGEAALPIIGPAAGLTPDQVAKYEKYLADVADFSVFAANELKSTDSPFDKAKKITDQFDAIVQPELPPGLPTTVLNVIKGVIDAVATFMKTIPSTAVMTAAKKAGKPLVLPDSDLKKLPAVQTRALGFQAATHKHKSGR